MPHTVNVPLPHEQAVVGADQHRAERMMPVHDGLSRDRIGGAKVGEHLVAGHRRGPIPSRPSGYSPDELRGGVERSGWNESAIAKVGCSMGAVQWIIGEN